MTYWRTFTWKQLNDAAKTSKDLREWFDENCDRVDVELGDALQSNVMRICKSHGCVRVHEHGIELQYNENGVSDFVGIAMCMASLVQIAYDDQFNDAEFSSRLWVILTRDGGDGCVDFCGTHIDALTEMIQIAEKTTH